MLETVHRNVVLSSESLKTTHTTIPFIKDNEFDYGWLTGGNTTVSYTHLDVYKRQERGEADEDIRADREREEEEKAEEEERQRRERRRKASTFWQLFSGTCLLYTSSTWATTSPIWSACAK